MLITPLEHWTFAPGDLIAFSGRGRTSMFIKAVTCSVVSHVGIVGRFGAKVYLYESTTLSNLPCEITGRSVCGVQAHDPRTRIQSYDGRIWVYRLAEGEELDTSESDRLTKFLNQFVGKPYDEAGAILSEIRQIINLTPAGLEKFFCSELTAAALMRVNKLPRDNPGRYTPGRLLRTVRRIGVYGRMARVK